MNAGDGGAAAVDVERFAAPPVTRAGPLRVLYAGTVGMAQGVGVLVEAARRAGPGVVEVTVAGAGAELDAVRRAARGASNVRVLGAVPADAVPSLYARADVAAVVLRDRPLFADALPTKVFEAMAAGRPVVLAGRGEAAALVEHAGAGVAAAPEDVATRWPAAWSTSPAGPSTSCAPSAPAARHARTATTARR